MLILKSLISVVSCDLVLAVTYFNALGLNGMADKQRRIQKLILSIISYLRNFKGAARGIDLTLNKLATIDLSDRSFIDAPPQELGTMKS